MARAAAVWCAIACGGCAALSPLRPADRTVAEYRPGGPATAATVATPAVYDLVRTNTGSVVVSRFLTAGPSVGFDRDGAGEARAVAGDERWAVAADAPHHWRVSPVNAGLERERKLKGAAAQANRTVGDGAEVVGRVCYPPLWVAAWPLGIIRGGMSDGLSAYK